MSSSSPAATSQDCSHSTPPRGTSSGQLPSSTAPSHPPPSPAARSSSATLPENLKGCPDFGLKMAAPITLDLNGHTISAAGWGVIASGGTIKNGSIVGSRGITDNGHGAAGPLTITHVRLRGGTLALDEAA